MARFLMMYAVAAVCLLSTARADVDDTLAKIKHRQKILAGMEPGSATIARAELKELYEQLSKEANDDQLRKTGELMLDMFSGLKTVMTDYYASNDHGRGSAYIPREMIFLTAADTINKYKTVAGAPIFQAGGVDISEDKLKAATSFADELLGISRAFSEQPEPESQVLAGKMKALSGLMSNFGDDLPIPVVNKLIKALGDVTSEMIGAVLDIEDKLNARNPFLNAATVGDGGAATAWKHQIKEDLARVTGLRDAYVEAWSGRQHVWLFDRNGKHYDKATDREYPGNFIPISRQPAFAGQSQEQIIRTLRRRFRLLHQAGIESPTIDQILYESTRVLRPNVVIAHDAIVPGEGFPLRIDAYRALDGERLPQASGITFEIRQPGGLLGDQIDTAAHGQTITWTAPAAPGKHTLTVTLTEASIQAGWRLEWNAPVTAHYVIGEKTRLLLKLQQETVATTRRNPLRMVLRLHPDDEDLPAIATGRLILRTDPDDVVRLAKASADWELASGSSADGSLDLTGGQGSLNELINPIRIALIPASPDGMPPGAVRIIAEYLDELGADRNRALRQSARAEAVMRIVDPPTLAVDRFVLTARADAQSGRYTLALQATDSAGKPVRDGRVTLQCEDGGFFPGMNGEHVELAGHRETVWVAPENPPENVRFRLTYSGAQGEDCIYTEAKQIVLVKLPGNAAGEEEALLLPAEIAAGIAAATVSLPDDETIEEEEATLLPPSAVSAQVAPDDQAEDEASLIPGLPASATIPPSTTAEPATTAISDPEVQKAFAAFGVGNASPVTAPAAEPQTPATPVPAYGDVAGLPLAPSFTPVPVNPQAERLDPATLRGYRSPLIEPPISIPAFPWNETRPTTGDLPGHLMQWCRAPYPVADEKEGRAKRDVRTNGNLTEVLETFQIAGHELRRKYQNNKLEYAEIRSPDRQTTYALNFVWNKPPDRSKGVNTNDPTTVFGQDVVVDTLMRYTIERKTPENTENVRMVYDLNGNCTEERTVIDSRILTDQRTWRNDKLVEEQRMIDNTLVCQSRNEEGTMLSIECYSYFRRTSGDWAKLKNGPKIDFHLNGLPRQALVYEQDEPDGKKVEWHATGHLKELTIKEGETLVFSQRGSEHGRLIAQNVRISETQMVGISWSNHEDKYRIEMYVRDTAAGHNHNIPFNASGLRDGEEFWQQLRPSKRLKRIYWKNGVKVQESGSITK